jgi:hypothetical protein
MATNYSNEAEWERKDLKLKSVYHRESKKGIENVSSLFVPF